MFLNFGKLCFQVVGAPHLSPNQMPPGTPPAALTQGPGMPPVSVHPGARPTWSGETHPALAQVPRTPQQLQHLQRLQMQREQQQQMEHGGPRMAGPQQVGPPVVPGQPGVQGQPPPPQQMLGQPQVQMSPQPGPGGQFMHGPPQQAGQPMQNGSNQVPLVMLLNVFSFAMIPSTFP